MTKKCGTERYVAILLLLLGFSFAWALDVEIGRWRGKPSVFDPAARVHSSIFPGGK